MVFLFERSGVHERSDELDRCGQEIGPVENTRGCDSILPGTDRCSRDRYQTDGKRWKSRKQALGQLERGLAGSLNRRDASSCFLVESLGRIIKSSY